MPKGYSDVSVVERLLFINSGAIHTTSNVCATSAFICSPGPRLISDGQSLTHALYDLASMPEYIEPLREEVEPIIAEEGWTKNAITTMSKLDSFLKESTRIHGIVLSTSLSPVFLSSPSLTAAYLCSVFDSEGNQGRHSRRRHSHPQGHFRGSAPGPDAS